MKKTLNIIQDLFLSYRCMLYTNPVNIMSLQGTKQAKEPLKQKGSLVGAFNRICSFLYSLDITVISTGVRKGKVYKKATFYTYDSLPSN